MPKVPGQNLAYNQSLQPKLRHNVHIWALSNGCNDSVVYGRSKLQIKNFPCVDLSFSSKGMHLDETCASIHPSYAHIVLWMSLTHWVKFQPKFYAQILFKCVRRLFLLHRANNLGSLTELFAQLNYSFLELLP
jgi:hypothetical protein